MDDSGLAYMIENGLVSDPVFKQTLEDPNVHARNIRIGDTSYIYLSDGLSKNRAMAVLALGHEMGHHLYSVAWDNLSQDGRNRLREAFDKSPAGKVIAQELLDAQATNDPEGAVSTSQEYEGAFNEWMADQLATWITKRAVPKTAVEKFFNTVGQKIRQLYQFMKNRERFQLDQTFSDFADAVADRARKAANVNDASTAQTQAWFKNEGVTMYKWWGGLRTADNMTNPFGDRAMTDEVTR
jgi:hypothetical protein